MTAKLASIVDRVVTEDEARAYLESPVTAAEREEVLALVAWFRRRYPTPAARLAYARRAYGRWRRHEGEPPRRS